jgi:cell division protein FtsI (penicillin-binding protein 3)
MKNHELNNSILSTEFEKRIVEVSEERAINMSKARLLVVSFALAFCFATLILRVFDLSLSTTEELHRLHRYHSTKLDFFVDRADIVDCEHRLLATNLSTASLYANPKEMLDIPSVIDELVSVFPDLSKDDLQNKLDTKKNFAWIKRHLTPKQQQQANDLGIPGLYFASDQKRVYPQGNLFAHIVGMVDIDGEGIAGLEASFDGKLKNNEINKLELSLDSRVQDIIHSELQKAMAEHQAEGAAAIVMNANNGEIVAMVSLPDFDPHQAKYASERERFFFPTLGVYEPGSVFKALTVAIALENGLVNLHDNFDVSHKLKLANFTISDYRGRGGSLSVPEILLYSSNLGTAQIAMRVGAAMQRNYLQKLGLLQQTNIELPENASPLYPKQKRWQELSTITISYGHGIAETPLHVVKAFAALINGGKLIEPTLLKQQAEKTPAFEQVISPQTSDLMRKLLRLVVQRGFGKKADVPGYFVGGKTGTSEKIGKNGRYMKNSNVASFVGAFPMNNPQYVISVILDAAKPNAKNHGFTTGGMIAAPLAGNIISNIAPLLEVYPNNAKTYEIINQELYLDPKPNVNNIAQR